MSKVIIIYTHITPRLIRRIQCLSERIPKLVALELATAELTYPWWKGQHNISGVRKASLFNQSLDSLPKSQIINKLAMFLEEEKPDIVILSGYNLLAMRYAAKWVKSHGGKTILLAVSCFEDNKRWWIKELAKGYIVCRLFDAVCVSGERSQKYFNSLGFNYKNIWKQFNVIDNIHFSEKAENARQYSTIIRQELCLPEKYFLYVGAFESWKNIPFLIDSYAKYRSAGGLWGLVLVGDGTQLQYLKETVVHQKIPDIIFTGIKKHDETPVYYGLASCFVLPSLIEPWGLVINEAAASSLPILASNRCGCVPELVHRGINGYIFEPDNTHELTELMHLISGSTIDITLMGKSSYQIMQYYTPEHWADALSDCVRQVQI